MALKPESENLLNEVSNTISKNTKEIMETVISKNINIDIIEIKEFSFDEFKENYQDSVVMVNFNIAKDPEGTAMVFIEKGLAVKIANWMMMMDEEEFSEIHLDSIKETANQILGLLTTSLPDVLGDSVEFKDLDAKDVEVNENLFEAENLIATIYDLEIIDEDKWKIFQVITESSVEKYIETAQQMEKKEEPEADEEEKIEEKPEEPEKAEEVAGTEETVSTEKEVTEKEVEESEEEKTEEIPGFDLGDFMGEEEETPEEEKMPKEATEIPLEAAEGVSKDKLNLLFDLSLPVSIELGRTKMLIKDILELGHGSVIEFDKFAGEPVDLLINDKKVAEGEIVVIDEHFGIRITSLVKTSERIKSLGK